MVAIEENFMVQDTETIWALLCSSAWAHKTIPAVHEGSDSYMSCPSPQQLKHLSKTPDQAVPLKRCLRKV